ncbi:MAG TPA: APC family permease, partial [Candidatus Solibacter sp.]|nr:APC family permease [Candidatus Solibacter sp.]
ELKRELGLRDITLMAIACIVGTRWIPAAAHAGAGSVTLWFLAALLFMVPLAIAVAALSVKYPGTGGLYLWTRNDFGRFHGFLCFAVYWIGLAIWFPSAAMFYMAAGLYAVNPALSESRAFVLAVSLAAIWIALGTNLIGVKIGKWTQNIGASSSWVIGGLLVVLAIVLGARRGSATPINIAPKWNWDTVNFWATIAYALSGLEMAGLMGGEIHDPERNLPRAGWIASAFAATFYAGATIAMLVLLRPDRISEMNGYGQIATVASDETGIAWLAPLLAILVLASAIGQFGGIGTSISRLPFAAGVDRLLPEAFGRVHPRWGTPYLSLLVLGVIASGLLIAMQIGDTMRTAYQELVSLMVIVGFLPYIYIFGSAWKAGKRISAISGWAITLLAIVCAVVPTSDVNNVWLFEGKLIGGTAAVILVAWWMYRRAA